MADEFDVFVIGAGVAGLAAAEEAAGRGLAAAIAEEMVFGGLVLNVNHLDPGLEGQPASGSDLAAEAMTRLAERGVALLFEGVTSIAPRPEGGFRLHTGAGTHDARTVVVATGARLRRSGIPGEAVFEQRGVSQCADCDAPLYRGQPVVVLGGGDSALQEALVLAEHCEVHLVHRGESFRARADFVDAVRRSARITTHMRTTVEALEGGDRLEAAILRELPAGEARRIPARGFFAYVGLAPNTGCLPAEIETQDGRVRVREQLESSLPGVYAIGAVRAGFPGLAADACEDAKSAIEAICLRLGRGRESAQ